VEDSPDLLGEGTIPVIPEAEASSGDDGRYELTRYRVLARCPEGFAWVALQPITGKCASAPCNSNLAASTVAGCSS
jgi:hypothetical protein